MQRPSYLARALACALLVCLPTAAQDPRVHTDRPTGAQLLKLPKEDDAFGFIVFGDRTGGPVEGIEVLKQAVADTNLLDPDLVFTVGDLVNGYNADAAWKAQAAEYKGAMAKLRMPWFPVAGNHDIYWRGEGKKPEGEHEKNFELTFGPLWYAVQHKKCWFIALYSDEGNPETGEKNFNKPECQRMSAAQFAWLGETLKKAKGARHVFLFLHHPRWLARYGDDWQKVHELLAKNGNVTAVFAGHIHRMRYDGTKDGIQYYTVASVGAHLEFEAPQAGYLHQFHVVTVRPEGITVAALPVGTVMDAKEITGQVSEDVDLVHSRVAPVVDGFVAAGSGAPLTVDGTVDAVLTLRLENPATRAIEIELVPQGDDSWTFGPDHQHLVIAPRGKASTTFGVRRSAPNLPFTLPKVEMRCDYLAATRRIGLPKRSFELALPPPPDLGQKPAAHQGVLVLDGQNACLEVSAEQLALPDGPLTLEAWLFATDFTGRRALVAKTQSSEFCLFCSDGNPEFSVFLGDKYATAKTEKPALQTGRWHHLAGVFDGAMLRCYVDGALVAEVQGKGMRKGNSLPLFVGADPDGASKPTSFFAGKVDEVRLSKTARYTAAFQPAARFENDAATVLLLHLDQDFGPWTPDASAQKAHPRRRGSAHCTVESREPPR